MLNHLAVGGVIVELAFGILFVGVALTRAGGWTGVQRRGQPYL